ncbi:predicted protein [Nematostella vectensis]|uniref:Homologous recombination OB-fold protein OB-fold domain-containing protein n=1 Tax=Nematostella vectensis TaxID=45351 RepID=A7SFF9_NEMVE|nr:predicted protein [Nematostella vectensis]|eukprot:XP_001629634.1 predicted protein [Nematostella vectensis]
MSALFAIDEDDLDLAVNDEEFLLAACGITPNTYSTTSTNGSYHTQAKAQSHDKIVAASHTQTTSARLTQAKAARHDCNQSSNITGISSVTQFKRTPLESLAKDPFKLKIQQLSEKTVEEPLSKRFATETNFPMCFTTNSTKDSFTENDITNVFDTGSQNKLLTTRTSQQDKALHQKTIVNRNTLPSGSSTRVFSQSKLLNSRNANHSAVLHSKSKETPQRINDNFPAGTTNTTPGQAYTETPRRDKFRVPGVSNNECLPRRSNPKTPKTDNDNEALKKNKNITPRRSDTPSREYSITPRRSQRKFPGPAGLLPKLTPGQNIAESNVPNVSPISRRTSPTIQTPVLQSSSEDEDFNRDPWLSMYKEFIENAPSVMRYTVGKVLKEAAAQNLKHGKVPCLCVLMKTFSPIGADASILLKDPTGEIHGTLHRKVLEEYQTELGTGAGLILKQVSVFSPSPRKHYLNITPGNILQIFSPNSTLSTGSQPLTTQTTQPLSSQRLQSSQRSVAGDDFSTQELFLNDTSQQCSSNVAVEVPKENFDDLLQGLDEDDLFDDSLMAF